MEMPLAGWGKILDYEKEIREANYPSIRLLHIERETSFQPLENIRQTRDGWQVCSPATIPEFSATAYFFGRNLSRELNIPIGLISSSWGGTVAEAWTSGESLIWMPEFKDRVVEISKQSDEEIRRQYEIKTKEWNQLITDADKGYKKGEAVWAGNYFNDQSWKRMSLPNIWENVGMDNFDGIVWFRKEVIIPESWKGKSLNLSLGSIDDDDITFFNGEQIGASEGYNIKRIYAVPAKWNTNNKAVITVRVTDTNGAGGFSSKPEEIYLSLQENPASTISLAGDWKYESVVNFNDFPSRPVSSLGHPNRPTVLYNAMIHPLIPYAIQGVIWYQGESNVGNAPQYRELFPLMIRDWRKQWNKDFPFYFVQLANFLSVNPEPTDSDWAELREAQLQTLHLGGTGIAVTIDIGEASDIHPKNKQEVGRRLALNALAQTYGKDIPFSGPIYKGYRIEGNQIRINFDHAEGLKILHGSSLKGFAIAGPDHVFHWADAEIIKNEVIVSSPKVPFPVAVRYAWADNPECNLYNGADLPASPFRTNDWKK